MLKPAYPLKSQIEARYQEILYEERYRYYFASPYRDFDTDINSSGWGQIAFASVSCGELLGYFSVDIDRSHDKGEGLRIINFANKNNITFSRDLREFLLMLFTKFNLRKIEFSVIVGNDIEKMYDRYIQKYGGRIVGTFTRTVKLLDNQYYDKKYYEISREEFLKRWEYHIKK